jgi:hypothetical protein
MKKTARKGRKAMGGMKRSMKARSRRKGGSRKKK